VEGKLVKGIGLEQAEAAVMQEIGKLLKDGISEKELQKTKNKTESLIAFEDMSVMNRANSLAFYELLGDAEMMNDELRRYQSITSERLMEEARKIFREENSNTLYYKAIA
jgi:predicted Zn-dependent peptidase